MYMRVKKIFLDSLHLPDDHFGPVQGPEPLIQG